MSIGLTQDKVSSVNRKAVADTTQTNERLDRLVLEARRSAEKREQGYRAQALKLFPWVCGRCARIFARSLDGSVEIL